MNEYPSTLDMLILLLFGSGDGKVNRVKAEVQHHTPIRPQERNDDGRE